MNDDKTEVLLGESGPSEAGWHSIADFLRCPKEWQFRHIRGIRKPATRTPDHFAVGSGFHAGRARWFSLKFKTDDAAWDSITQAVREDMERQRLPPSPKAEATTINYLQQYVNHWSKRPLPKPVAAEYKLGPAPMKPDDPFFLYRTARLDDVSHYPDAGGKLCIGESKTTSTSVNDCVNEYTLHGQTLLQLLLWRTANEGAKKHGPAAGIMLDVTVKGYGDRKCSFGRQFLPITDYMLDWYVKNMRQFLRAAQNYDWNTDVPRNISACTRMAGRARVECEFRELCMYGRSATIKYVLKDGQSLLTWKPTGEQLVAPWL